MAWKHVMVPGPRGNRLAFWQPNNLDRGFIDISHNTFQTTFTIGKLGVHYAPGNATPRSRPWLHIRWGWSAHLRIGNSPSVSMLRVGRRVLGRLHA